MEEIGKETRKQTELVIKLYGIEIARDRHIAMTKNVCTTKNTRMKIIFTSVKMEICGTKNTCKFCPARKYVAYKRLSKVHVFHVTYHTCKAKSSYSCPRPPTIVESVVAVDPTTPSSSIQLAAILKEIRGKKSFERR